MKTNSRTETNLKRHVIGIIDLDIGNTVKIKTFLEKDGYKTHIVTPEDIRKNIYIDSLIIPGIGNFGMIMGRIREEGIDFYVRRQIELGNRVIGICVGAQILLEYSEESSTAGLGLLQGFNSLNANNFSPLNIGRQEVLFRDLKNQEYNSSRFYFAHQYGARLADDSSVVAVTSSGIVALFKKDNIYGLQFHPEKSGMAGMNVMHGIMDGKL